MQPKVIKENVEHKGRFLQFKSIDWVDKNGNEAVWESVNRVSKDNGIVSIIPILMPSRMYVIIRNYRPPVDSYVLEFPAGLVDDGEDIEEAALRELKEETGYIGKVLKVTPPTLSSSGLSDEAVSLVVVEINENDPKNQNPEQNLESEEDIEVWLVRENEVKLFIDREIKNGSILSGRFASYFLGKGQV